MWPCDLCGFVPACVFHNLLGASGTLINLPSMFCLNLYGFQCLATESLFGAPYFPNAAKPGEQCHDNVVWFHMSSCRVTMGPQVSIMRLSMTTGQPTSCRTSSCTDSNSDSPGATTWHEEPPRATWSQQETPGATRGYQELPGTTGSHH